MLPKGSAAGLLAGATPAAQCACLARLLAAGPTILVGFLGELGPILGSILAISYWKTYYFVQNDVFEKIRLQDLSWTDLGPIWAPKGVQDGGLLGPKLGQRSLKMSSWEVLRS